MRRFHRSPLPSYRRRGVFDGDSHFSPLRPHLGITRLRSCIGRRTGRGRSGRGGQLSHDLAPRAVLKIVVRAVGWNRKGRRVGPVVSVISVGPVVSAVGPVVPVVSVGPVVPVIPTIPIIV